MDPADAVAPGPAHRLGEEPAAVALARQLGDEADEGELALPGLAKVELDHPGVAPLFVGDGVKLDVRIEDDRVQGIVVHRQPGEPQPRRADEAEQGAIAVGDGQLDAAER